MARLDDMLLTNLCLEEVELKKRSREKCAPLTSNIRIEAGLTKKRIPSEQVCNNCYVKLRLLVSNSLVALLGGKDPTYGNRVP